MGKKEKILIVSNNMFNEKGFSNVTIRMIASELGMSSGNLNYHFKKREDILEALYFEMVSEFDERVKQLGNRELSLKNIQKDIQLSMERMVHYSFFWTDLYNLLRLNNKIKTHFSKAYNDRTMGYQFLFKSLKKNKLLKEFEYEKQSESLIETMINYSNTWLYNSYLYDEKIDDNYISLQSFNLLSMLYPYLTDLGKKDFKEVFDHK